MKPEFQEYQTRKIVNVHRHVDSWFWNKYSATPYVGCRSGCEFCYQRGGKYAGRRDPKNFDSLIRVKTNAPERLYKDLQRLKPDVISCGDWQLPAESTYRLSRDMLKIVHDLQFPLFIVERSPFLTNDLDLLADINRQSWVGVALSISSLEKDLKRAFEPKSPGIQSRLKAMSKLADAGITVGTALMPIIPLLGDRKEQLEDVVRTTRDHGGVFVLAGGLTMAGIQAERTLLAAHRYQPEVIPRIRKLYHWPDGGKPAYGPSGSYSARIGRLVRNLCIRHQISDRIPRYTDFGPHAVNKRLAEKLFLRSYDLELEQAKGFRIWAYRKAAWTVDECPESLSEIYKLRGLDGLLELPAIGKHIAGEIGGWLNQHPAL